MVDFSIPQVNFYSMLSGLGDTLQKNAELRQQQNIQNARQGVFQKYAALDPSSPDYGVQTLGMARDLGAAGDTAGALKFIEIAHQASQDARQAKRDAASDAHTKFLEGMASRADQRAAYEFEHTPDQYVPNPKAGQPGEPAVIDQYAQAAAAAQNGKPVPFETLSGTKFMVRQPNGAYSVVDPTAVGQGAPPSPVAAPAANAGAPPAASPQVGGAPPQPSAAPATPTSAAPPAATPPDLEAVDPTTGRRENWLKAQSPDVQAYIKKIADYEIDPRTTSIKGGHREQVMSAVAQYDPTYDQNTFGSRAKAIKDFSTGQQGNSIRSFDVAIDHLDTLQKYSDALKSGDVRLINQLRNAWLRETGSALPTNVQAVAPIVGAEVSKAIIGSNNALADREELRKPLQIANSPEQISGAIEGYKNLMAGQLKGLKKQYEDTTGKKDFNTRIRDNTRRVLLGDGQGSDAQPNVTATGVKWSIQ